jgi:hypothetical protein
MLKKIILSLTCLLALSFLTHQLNAKDEKIKVKFGLNIKKLVPDYKEGKFNTEFYWWMIFENDSTKSGLGNDVITNLEYVNAVDFPIEGFKAEIQEVREIGKNKFYYTGFHQGEFYFNPDFRMYPLDIQTLNISIENSILASNQYEIISDTTSYINSKQNRNFWGFSNDLLVNKNESYFFSNVDIQIGKGMYNTNFGDPDFDPISYYSRINTAITLNRSFIPYISKLLIPLIIILLLVYFVFYLPAEKIDIAAGLTVTSLLSAIAFQLAVSGELPDIGYIIYIDKIFYTCYFLIAITMAQSLITFYLDDSGIEKNVKKAKQIDVAFRYLFPILFLLSTILFAKI